MVKRHGFNVTTYDKNAAGKEKKVDVAIAHKMTKMPTAASLNKVRTR